MDWLYLISEFNVIPSIDQNTYWLDFQNASTQTIFLYAVIKKVDTSNKVAITCLCKKSCNLWSQCKCCKNKVNVVKIRLSVHSIVIWQDKIVVMRIQ